jgi:hypothetical protein
VCARSECGFNHWFITSAKKDHNIKNGMHTLIGEILRVAKGAGERAAGGARRVDCGVCLRV